MGIMITASHNHHEDNGFKIFSGDGRKLSIDDEHSIESFISDGIMISEKYESILELNKSNIPTDIEVMINNHNIYQ